MLKFTYLYVLFELNVNLVIQKLKNKHTSLKTSTASLSKVKFSHQENLALLSLRTFEVYFSVFECKPESTKQTEEKLNYRVPSEGLELVILLHTQY